MKYIKVKDEIRYELEENGVKTVEHWSFYRYLEEIVVRDHAMGFGYRSLKNGVEIKKKFKSAEIGTWVGLDDIQYDKIKVAVLHPKSIVKERSILELFISFMEAIVEEAQDRKPDVNT